MCAISEQVNRECEYAPDREAGKPAPALQTRKDIESEIEDLDGRIAELKYQLSELNTEPIRDAARELLDLCCTDADDPDATFTSAFEFLLRAANVAADYANDSVHPSTALEVLIEKFGIESVRDWTRDCAKQSRRRR